MVLLVGELIKVYSEGGWGASMLSKNLTGGRAGVLRPGWPHEARADFDFRQSDRGKREGEANRQCAGGGDEGAGIWGESILEQARSRGACSRVREHGTQKE